jgi:hypothetical protein
VTGCDHALRMRGNFGGFFEFGFYRLNWFQKMFCVGTGRSATKKKKIAHVCIARLGGALRLRCSFGGFF